MRFRIGIVPSSLSCKVLCFSTAFYHFSMDAVIAIALDNSHSGAVINGVLLFARNPAWASVSISSVLDLIL